MVLTTITAYNINKGGIDMNTMSIITIVVVSLSIIWSLGTLLFGLIKYLKKKKQDKETEKEVLQDVNETRK